MARKHRTKGKRRPPESKKISKLVREGEPQDKAVAMAMSMKRAGRLTPSGGYRHVGKKKSRKRSRKA